LHANAVKAALADATIIVEAGWRSGSLNTAGHAVGLKRGLGAVPGPITSANSAGTSRLVREFSATLVSSAAEAIQLVEDNRTYADVPVAEVLPREVTRVAEAPQVLEATFEPFNTDMDPEATSSYRVTGDGHLIAVDNDGEDYDYGVMVASDHVPALLEDFGLDPDSFQEGEVWESLADLPFACVKRDGVWYASATAPISFPEPKIDATPSANAIRRFVTGNQSPTPDLAAEAVIRK